MDNSIKNMIDYLKNKSPQERMWERIHLVDKINALLILPNLINMQEAKECFDRLYLLVQAEEALRSQYQKIE